MSLTRQRQLKMTARIEKDVYEATLDDPNATDEQKKAARRKWENAHDAWRDDVESKD